MSVSCRTLGQMLGTCWIFTAYLGFIWIIMDSWILLMWRTTQNYPNIWYFNVFQRFWSFRSSPTSDSMGPTGKLIGNQNHGVLAPDLKVSCRCFLPGTKYLTKLETLVEITNLGENWHCSFSFRGSWRFLQSLRLCRAHIYIYNDLFGYMGHQRVRRHGRTQQ